MPSYSEAYDTIARIVRTAWLSSAPGVVGYAPALLYDGVDARPPLGEYWARLTVRTSLATGESVGRSGAAGGRLYRCDGVLSVQIFAPAAHDDAVTKLRALAPIIRSAFRLPSNNADVHFADATVREQPPEDRWKRIDVSATYTYWECE